jgi:hypothetical protein
VRSLFSLSFARIIYRVPKENTTAKKEPALKDSRFHINNTSQSIKALGQYRERYLKLSLRKKCSIVILTEGRVNGQILMDLTVVVVKEQMPCSFYNGKAILCLKKVFIRKIPE